MIYAQGPTVLDVDRLAELCRRMGVPLYRTRRGELPKLAAQPEGDQQ